MEKVKSCPFCGSDEIMLKYNGSRHGRFYYMECDVCGGRTRGICVPTKELDGLDEWNNDAAAKVERLWNRRCENA